MRIHAANIYGYDPPLKSCPSKPSNKSIEFATGSSLLSSILPYNLKTHRQFSIVPTFGPRAVMTRSSLPRLQLLMMLSPLWYGFLPHPLSPLRPLIPWWPCLGLCDPLSRTSNVPVRGGITGGGFEVYPALRLCPEVSHVV